MDAEESAVLDGITKWMSAHGEAIHGTRPWTKFGEGPAQASGGMFSERSLKQYTAQDFRFTKKGEVLYAICLGVPAKQAVIQSLTENAPQKVQRVELMGRKQPLKFQRSAQGLCDRHAGRNESGFGSGDQGQLERREANAANPCGAVIKRRRGRDEPDFVAHVFELYFRYRRCPALPFETDDRRKPVEALAFVVMLCLGVPMLLSANRIMQDGASA